MSDKKSKSFSWKKFGLSFLGFLVFSFAAGTIANVMVENEIIGFSEGFALKVIPSASVSALMFLLYVFRRVRKDVLIPGAIVAYGTAGNPMGGLFVYGITIFLGVLVRIGLERIGMTIGYYKVTQAEQNVDPNA